MHKTDCELCGFNNPKGSATAIIIRDNKVLMLRRNEEPFRGMWDLPGGYMSGNETPQQSVVREVREELGIEPLDVLRIAELPGKAFWKDKEFPIVSHFFLIDIGDREVKLNGENSEWNWVPIKELDANCVAFDSNCSFVRQYLKMRFLFDLPRIRQLIQQLDSSAELREQMLYRAVLCGYVAQQFDGDKLVGMGWIYPRNTMLRHQAVVEDMIVDNDYRGKKLGEKILVDLLGWAKKQGVEVVELTSGWHRQAAHGLYKKNGFKLHDTAHMLLRLTE